MTQVRETKETLLSQETNDCEMAHQQKQQACSALALVKRAKRCPNYS